MLTNMSGSIYVIARIVIFSVFMVSGAFGADVPRYAVDASWPKTLPNDWIMGQAAGVAVDENDHIWVVQRPRTLTEDEKAAALAPPRSKCCKPAPPVLEFDQEGNLLRSWGGPGQGYDWPQNEHGIYIDAKGFVWLAANGDNDGQVLKFTKDGKFVKQLVKSDVLFARDLALSPDADQQFLYVGGGNGIFIVDRKTLEIVGNIEPPGIIGPGHQIATDSKGNLYIAQTTAGMQKLTFKGMSSGTR